MQKKTTIVRGSWAVNFGTDDAVECTTWAEVERELSERGMFPDEIERVDHGPVGTYIGHELEPVAEGAGIIALEGERYADGESIGSDVLDAVVTALHDAAERLGHAGRGDETDDVMTALDSLRAARAGKR